MDHIETPVGTAPPTGRGVRRVLFAAGSGALVTAAAWVALWLAVHL